MSKSLKVLGIIGVIWSIIAFFLMSNYNSAGDFNAVVGVSFLAEIYLLVMSIVTIVQSKNI